jgi:cytidylate kinase
LFITLSRQTGSLGEEITELLAKKLDLPVITRDWVMSQWFPEIATNHELHMLSESPAFFLNTSSQGSSFAEYLEAKLRESIAGQPAIIVGLGAQIIFAGYPEALHVKIIASREIRTTRVGQTHCLEKKDAERFLEITDRKHRRYINTIYGKDWADPALYHITLNTNYMTAEQGAEIIYYIAQNRTVCPSPSAEPVVQKERQPAAFKHPSEEEFAKILDMHDIDWEYEPTTFPIRWDAEGNVTQAFSPDFYLPGFDTYIELTTMDQRYVAEKKKKVQLLKKLYPGTNIAIVFKNDFYSLVRRFRLREGIDSR